MVQILKGNGLRLCNGTAWKERIKGRRFHSFLCITVACLCSTCFAYSNFVKVDEARNLDKQITYIWNRAQYILVDFDSNGQINCCDVATAFCIKWKATYSTPIRLCQQQTGRMNHMYVQLLTSWGWWSVDPKYTGIGGSHDMMDVWGSKYSVYGDDANGYWVRYFSRYID